MKLSFMITTRKRMNFTEVKEKARQNDKAKTEYDKLASEFSLINQLINMRTQAGLTQAQLAERMHTQKSNISRLERGNSNPSWTTLQKYAHACGFDLSLKAQKMELLEEIQTAEKQFSEGLGVSNRDARNHILGKIKYTEEKKNGANA
ncbi:MAG: helix-turn-helix transcriptional regulator [Marinomonas sp.]